MSFDAADLATIASRLDTKVPRLTAMLPGDTSVAEQVGVVAPSVWAEMQRTLRGKYGDLPAPLGDELLPVAECGVLADLLTLQWANLADDEKAWVDEWRRRFTEQLAALAAGVDVVDGVSSNRPACVTSSREQVFTDDALEDLL